MSSDDQSLRPSHPSFSERARRYVRLARRTGTDAKVATPPFLILFINSICNLTCEHCFYWKSLNRRDDLTFDEIKALSEELGTIENLNLSGGEPFIRAEFADIVRLFIRNNRVTQVYVPTNAYYTERMRNAIQDVLREEALRLFVCEISLDGTAEYHNRFRGSSKSFEKAMETYAMLAELQKHDPRLRIQAISTATNENLGEIRALTDFLHQRCPAMEHHNLAIIRGDRKNASLGSPPLDKYQELYLHLRERWADREEGRFGATVEPMMQCAKMESIRRQTQAVPCKAGILSGVVYANGDVSVCELHAPIGNLRRNRFGEIWNSPEARQLRESIAQRDCWCTTEVFLWPSIVFQPYHLVRMGLKARVWQRPNASAV
jgi:MoaA/NifB/PqqE/SkfB family radical SAM enzyme